MEEIVDWYITPTDISPGTKEIIIYLIRLIELPGKDVPGIVYNNPTMRGQPLAVYTDKRYFT